MSEDNESGNSRGNRQATGTDLRLVTAGRPWPPPLPSRLGAFRDDYEAFCLECLVELGGSGEVTVKELALVESTAEVRVLRRKCGRNLLARGISKRNGDLRGPVKVYVALVNSERQGLMALGLSRRARQIPSLSSYLASRPSPATPDGAGNGDPSRDVASPSVPVEVSTPGQGETVPGGSGGGEL